MIILIVTDFAGEIVAIASLPDFDPNTRPAALTKGLGRYEVAVYRLARLAVALPVQGQGVGGDLLLAAGARALAVAAQVGGVALAIDAKDEKAAHWDERFGAMPLLDSSPLSLILPFKIIIDALDIARSERLARPTTRE